MKGGSRDQHPREKPLKPDPGTVYARRAYQWCYRCGEAHDRHPGPPQRDPDFEDEGFEERMATVAILLEVEARLTR